MIWELSNCLTHSRCLFHKENLTPLRCLFFCWRIKRVRTICPKSSCPSSISDISSGTILVSTRSLSGSASTGNITSTLRKKLRGIQSALPRLDLCIGSLPKYKYSTVFEKTIDDCSEPVYFHSGPETPGRKQQIPRERNLNWHACLTGTVKSFDDLMIC